jgi:hypothetical protein
MSFAQQAKTVAIVLAAALVAAIGVGVWAAAGQRWVTLTVVAVVCAVLAWAVSRRLRPYTARRDLGPLCDELREIARSVPTGTVRLFEHDASGLAVQCVPAGRGRTDSFSRYSLRDIAPIGAAAPGEVIRFPLTTVRIHRLLPMAARRVWVDQLVKDTERGPVHAMATDPGAPDSAAEGPAGRADLLPADRDDLEQILHLLWASDRVTDIPVASPPA